MLTEDRKQFVGLLTEDASIVLEEGAQIVAQPVPTRADDPCSGTSPPPTGARRSAVARSRSPSVVDGRERERPDTLHVPMPDRTIAVRVTDPVFYDKPGERLDG